MPFEALVHPGGRSGVTRAEEAGAKDAGRVEDDGVAGRDQVHEIGKPAMLHGA